MSETGSEVLTRVLLDAGIDVCFANPGTTEMHLVDALSADERVRCILGLHETVCTGAADGYGRMKGHSACTLLHLGPGLANGVANLHNARRASTPILNIIGDMAVWHAHADAALSMDIEALAGTVSRHVTTPKSLEVLAEEVNASVGAVAYPVIPGTSRISTLIVPHDLQWEKVPVELASPSEPHSVLGGGTGPGKPPSVRDELESLARRHLPMKEQEFKEMAAALAASGPKGCLFLGGSLLLKDSGGLAIADSIRNKTGTRLVCLNNFPRVDRGQGLPSIERMPYFPQEAAQFLEGFETVVIGGAAPPVAMFGYDGGPSRLLNPETTKAFKIDTLDLVSGLEYLAELLDANVPAPKTVVLPPPTPPTGHLNPNTLCTAIAALQPEGTIMVDESLTSGGSYWNESVNCPQFSHLSLTGGSIGIGPPLAVGCAVACPERRVINFQADGSGMYSIQALWTQARENLNVTTVICANSKYQILGIEMNRQKPKHKGRKPNAKQLLNLNNPCIDWVAIATGMGVPAEKVDTADAFVVAMRKALVHEGPYLIEAILK